MTWNVIAAVVFTVETPPSRTVERSEPSDEQPASNGALAGAVASVRNARPAGGLTDDPARPVDE